MPPQDESPNPPGSRSESAGNVRRQRLAAAMEAFLRFRDRTEGDDRERFLARHEDLRDLLEAMLDAEEGDAAGGPVAVAEPASLQPGRQVGDYRIVREVGRGGMGIVFEAEQISLRRRVALKLLHPHLAWSASAIERFRHEAAAAARLQHPAIVPIHEVGEWRGLHFFSMEFVDGQPLSALLHQDRLGVRPDGTRAVEAADLVARVADALQHAHEHGLVHRDVKPHNVMVGTDGAVRLLDFGLVKNVESLSQSASGAFLGTPQYCAPEQVAPGGEIGPRTDVFSLAIVLYEVLARRRPFDGDTTRVVLQRIEAGEFESLRRVAPSTPRDLETICHKALERAPAARYQTAGEFAADLRRFLRIEPIAARPPGPVARSVKWVRRHRTPVALIAAATLVVVGTPTAYALHQYDTAAKVERERQALDEAEDLGFRSIEQTLGLISEQLERQPGLPEQHRQRVDSVMRLCEEFMELRAQDPKRRARVVRALYVTSHVYSRMGQLDLGMQACERALEIVRDTTTCRDELGDLEDRLLRRRLHLELQQKPQLDAEAFEAAIGPWQQRVAAAGHDVDAAIEFADLLLVRARVLADRPNGLAEAERLLRRALAAVPDTVWAVEPHAEITALRCKTVLGIVLLSTGHARQALDVLEPTEARLRRLPQTPSIGVDRALATAAIGDAAQKLGQAGAAEASLRAAIESASALCKQYPGAQALRRTMLRSRVRLATLLIPQRQLDEAERLLRETRSELDPAAESWLDRSLNADIDVNLAGCILLRTKGGDRAEARELFRRACTALEALAAEQTDHLDFAVDLGAGLNNLAAIANENGEHAEAAACATRAIAQQQRVLAAVPGHRRATLFLAMHHSQLALASAHLGEHENAIAAAASAIEHAPRHASTLRIAAESACICACAATSGQAANEYARVAVDGLTRIAAVDREEARRWLEAPRFAYLSDRADFRKLVEETR